MSTPVAGRRPSRQASLFRALGDDTRLQLMQRLAESPATASQLCKGMEISRQAVMKHLAVLDDAGLVNRETSGRAVEYTTRAEAVEDLSQDLAALARSWDRRLADIKHRAEANARSGGTPERAQRAGR